MSMMKLGTGVLAAAIALAACNGGTDGEPAANEPTATPSPTATATATATPTSEATETPQAGEAEVEIEDFAFQPAEISVATGTEVVWKQRDAAPHTVTADDGSFDSGTMADRDEFMHVFDEPGTYAYHCAIHPAMTATVVVA